MLIIRCAYWLCHCWCWARELSGESCAWEKEKKKKIIWKGPPLIIWSNLQLEVGLAPVVKQVAQGHVQSNLGTSPTMGLPQPGRAACSCPWVLSVKTFPLSELILLQCMPLPRFFFAVSRSEKSGSSFALTPFREWKTAVSLLLSRLNKPLLIHYTVQPYSCSGGPLASPQFVSNFLELRSQTQEVVLEVCWVKKSNPFFPPTGDAFNAAPPVVSCFCHRSTLLAHVQLVHQFHRCFSTELLPFTLPFTKDPKYQTWESCSAYFSTHGMRLWLGFSLLHFSSICGDYTVSSGSTAGC